MHRSRHLGPYQDVRRPLAAQFNNSGLDQINRTDAIGQIICDPCGHGNLATCISDQQNRAAFDTVFVFIDQSRQILARHTHQNLRDEGHTVDFLGRWPLPLRCAARHCQFTAQLCNLIRQRFAFIQQGFDA